ncbi:replication protein A 70 kDa DNA-binding subunit B-like [Coffea arabica]|uniref:Replication protein A 70 kDa DNA-binding subunit B-like n=1 Tax=Coffea arabica TaxID=13443 RepID=A0A6P6U920_COFAR
MEENIISVSQLNVGVQSWVVRVVLIEKSFVRGSVNMGRHYQRYVFADQLGDRVQAIAYFADLNVLDEILQLFSTYYIGNGIVRRLMDDSIMLGSVSFEVTLTQHTLIERVHGLVQLPTDNLYNFTRFGHLQSLRHSRDAIITILGVVIKVFPLHVFLFGSRYMRVQEFLLMNEEMMPVVFAIWEEFVDTDGAHLAQIAHEHPIVLICRPKISHFHGLSLATERRTIIMYDVAIREADELRSWYEGLAGDGPN